MFSVFGFLFEFCLFCGFGLHLGCLVCLVGLVLWVCGFLILWVYGDCGFAGVCVLFWFGWFCGLDCWVCLGWILFMLFGWRFLLSSAFACLDCYLWLLSFCFVVELACWGFYWLCCDTLFGNLYVGMCLFKGGFWFCLLLLL